MTKATSQRGITYNYAYNSKGNPTSLTVANSGGDMKIKTEAAYTSNGAYLQSVADESGNTTTYNYNQVNGLLNSVTSSNGVTTSYTYDNSHRISSVSNGSSSVGYTYDSKSRLSEIDDNSGTKYTFTYDSFGNAATTKVGSNTLITNTYNAKNNGLSRSEYGNGDVFNYSYQQHGALSEKKINGTTRYKWQYDGSGTPIRCVDYSNNLCYNNTYDSIGRIVRQKVSTRNGLGGSSNRVYSSEYGYDALNNITKIAYTAGGKTFGTNYSYYSKDNLPEKATLYSNRYAQIGHDTLNRLNSRTVTTDAPVYMNYLYCLSGRNGDGETTYRTRKIHQEFIGDTAYRYTYDSLGNITKIEQGERVNKGTNNLSAQNYTVLAEYFYDNNNQLVRENNKQQNKTFLYNYDDKGNRTAFYEFDYFTDSPSTGPINSVYMDYRQDGWGDLLTNVYGSKYNSVIVYDEIGNPISYFGYDMSWTGRELDSLSGNGIAASYKYDSTGLRTQKIVNNVTSNYYYIDGRLYYESRGDKKLYYFYDNLGNLLMIKLFINGQELNYYVATNSRGDVECLYRGDGTIKARYTYDTWGKVLSVTDENGIEITDANNIGLLNPIRYRGYYYDEETGYYYLQSRYYDPSMGRFINGDGYADTGMGLTSTNMFTYCGNNPVMRADPSGEFWITAIVIGGALVGCALLFSGSSQTDLTDTSGPQPPKNNIGTPSINIDYSKRNKDFVPRKDPKKGSERRQPSRSRERNVGHPNGEEHSRIPKGNRPGITTKMFIVTGLSLAACVMIADDATGVGVADDAVAVAVIKMIWDTVLA